MKYGLSAWQMYDATELTALRARIAELEAQIASAADVEALAVSHAQGFAAGADDERDRIAAWVHARDFFYMAKAIAANAHRRPE